MSAINLSNSSCRISFTLDRSIYNRLFILSRYLGVSRSSIIIKSLESYLNIEESFCNYEDFLYSFMLDELAKSDSSISNILS